MIYFLITIISVLFSYFVGKMGEKRQIGFINSFLISLFLSPIIGLLVVAASIPLTKEELNLKENIEKNEESKNIPDGMKFLLVIIILILLFISIKTFIK